MANYPMIPDFGCKIEQAEEEEDWYVPWTPDQPVFDVECYEYECGSYCSPNGCHGHVTDFPVGFTYKGFHFTVEGYLEGDFPNDHKQMTKDYQRIFDEMAKKLQSED